MDNLDFFICFLVDFYGLESHGDASPFFTTIWDRMIFFETFFPSIEQANPRCRSYGSMFLFGCLFFFCLEES